MAGISAPAKVEELLDSLKEVSRLLNAHAKADSEFLF
jgi:hypothetical protein